tara:strand:- start:764 stop:1009 length:246 start_codon:yes stop_codon:yes gene_type:complete
LAQVAVDLDTVKQVVLVDLVKAFLMSMVSPVYLLLLASAVAAHITLVEQLRVDLAPLDLSVLLLVVMVLTKHSNMLAVWVD